MFFCTANNSRALFLNTTNSIVLANGDTVSYSLNTLVAAGAALGILMGIAPLVSGAAERDDKLSGDWYQANSQELQKIVFPGVVPQVVRRADAGEWNGIWTRMESLLQFQLLDDKIWMMALVNMTYAYRNLDVVRSWEAWKVRFQDQTLPQQFQCLLPQLKKVFESEGVPQQWVWIAEVESSLNPQAKSPVGAVGLFQLMPETAKRFGLCVFPFDERIQPGKSARAAAQYLKILYQQFGGWSLALAAYNAGEGRVSRMMQKHHAGTFNELSKHLPLETRMYVPKVMTTVALREDQARGVPHACRMP